MTKKTLKISAIFLGTLLLNACVSKINTLTNDVDKIIDEDSGYLLLSVSTNFPLHGINIEGEKKLRLSADNLTPGSKYILVDVPAGTYNIDQIKYNNYLYLALDEKLWTFDVKAGEISYVGNLDIYTNLQVAWQKAGQPLLKNRSSDALQFMELNFPTLLKARKLKYRGPGEDNFFQFVEQLQTPQVQP